MSGIARKAVLLAAGRGTRMRDLTNELPKPMIEVRGKPILHHIIEGLHHAGVAEVLIVVGYRADVVRSYFGDGSFVEGYGQIDLSTSYQITSHISVNASVSNLTESAFRLVDKYGITRLYDLSGRRFSAGIRASF